MSRIFGAVTQNGYVVRDIQTAMQHWAENLHVGPWFYVHDIPIMNFRYRGVPSDARMSVGIAYAGDLQIELIEPTNDAPSMYRDFLAAGHEGLQHICYGTSNFQADYDKALELGYVVGQEGCVGGEQGRFAYFDTQTHPGTVLELSDHGGPKKAIFDFMRKTAATWDGSRPIRHMN